VKKVIRSIQSETVEYLFQARDTKVDHFEVKNAFSRRQSFQQLDVCFDFYLFIKSFSKKRIGDKLKWPTKSARKKYA